MKYYSAQLGYLVRNPGGRRNLKVLFWFLGVLAGMIIVYTVLFHYIMLTYEDQEHSWLTGFYWTLTVMSTLGFGDITFHSDIGRAFSILVLMSGIVFLLVLLPFTIIQLFYAPWIEAQQAARTPKDKPEADGHVVLTHHDPVSDALIHKLEQFNHDYVMLVPDREQAARLHDMGMKVVVGELDDPQTFERVRADRAALIATTHNDFVNTHVVFTVRGLTPDAPIVTTANSNASVDIMELAGATQVLQLGEQMGQALTRCISGGDAITHVVGSVDELQIAEANATRTPMVGKTLREARLRELGVTVLGLWDRGDFRPASPDMIIGENSILLLAGSADQLEAYDEAFVIYNQSVDPILIIGGGRVGRAAARALSARDIDWRIVEKVEGRTHDRERTIVGDAADLVALKAAGIDRAPAALITSHDDDLNVYLTIYCRSLRPDIQIITRVSQDRNIAAMHRAGADFVMSYASMGATSMFNMIRRSSIVSIAEGLEVFRVPTPASLDAKTIIESGVRERTGCSIVAVREGADLRINPPAGMRLTRGKEMILVGSAESERLFLERFVED